MPGTPPRLEDLPPEFAVFPLAGALLLPHGRLPLNIFEPRYLAMTEDALAQRRLFAMIQPDQTRVPGPHGPGLHRIGCLGRITSFSETDDGRFLITLTGLTRFAVAEELDMRRGYRRVRADFAGFATDLQATPAVQGFDRAGLLDALAAYFRRRAIDANWDMLREMSDSTLLTTVCMVCPFDPVEQQALIESASAADRAGTLLALLRIDSHQDEDTRRHRRAS